MRRSTLLALAALAMSTTWAMAQPQEGPGRRGGPGGRGQGGPLPNPVLEAIDTNGDQESVCQTDGEKPCTFRESSGVVGVTPCVAD